MSEGGLSSTDERVRGHVTDTVSSVSLHAIECVWSQGGRSQGLGQGMDVPQEGSPMAAMSCPCFMRHSNSLPKKVVRVGVRVGMPCLASIFDACGLLGRTLWVA